MEPNIIDRDSFCVLGIASHVVRGAETPDTFQKIWENFESFREQIEPHSIDHSYYGISFPSSEGEIFDYIAGMSVKNVNPVPKGLEIREVPQGKYAVFDCAIKNVSATYRYIFGEWLPRSSYRLKTNAPSFEQYPPRDLRSTSVQLHIPIDV